VKVQGIHTHNNFFYFTTSLVVLLLASAFVGSSPKGEDHFLLQGIMLVTELVAYVSLNLTKKWRVFVGVMLAFMMLSSLLREFYDFPHNSHLSLIVALVFYSGMAYAAARQVLFSGDIELNTIAGTIAVYLLLGIVWAILYLITLEFWPTGINGIEYQGWHDNFSEAAYFSYITMTTLGYGDLSPAIPVTRTLAFLQAIAGTFYMAVVVASMVGRVSRTSK
jgi:voltage-gated potassium channel